jgi:hypothetical protein
MTLIFFRPILAKKKCPFRIDEPGFERMQDTLLMEVAVPGTGTSSIIVFFRSPRNLDP